MPPTRVQHFGPDPKKEQRSLIDEFNDFILLMDTKSWTNDQRRAYNALHRRIETVSNV